MELDKLIQATLKLDLLESSDEIDFIFVNYSLDKSREKRLTMEQQIRDVLTWAYQNNELEDFYLEYFDELHESLFHKYSIAHCEEPTNDSGYSRSYELYRLESNNLIYYKIKGYGLYHETLDTTRFWEIIKKSERFDAIEEFKETCSYEFDA